MSEVLNVRPVVNSSVPALADGLLASCGPDLMHDAAFRSLQQALAGRPEQQWGDTVVPAVEPDWHRVRLLAQELLQRTIDLRLLVPLARAQARLQGVAAVVPALTAILEALTNRWDTIHPDLDPQAQQDGVDPATARFSALYDLASRTGLSSDLRAFHGEPEHAETQGNPEPEVRVAARKVASLLGRISAALAERTAQTPLLDVQPLCTWLTRLAGELPAPFEADSAASTSVAGVRLDEKSDIHSEEVVDIPGPAFTAPLSRAGCARLLDAVIEWLERYEPAHPSPLLIRRARRLLDADFMQILRDLAPDAAHGVEQIAGGPLGVRRQDGD